MRGALIALVLLAPGAAAMDLLPGELVLGATEARILVRSDHGAVRVDTAPSVLAAAAEPEGEPGPFAPTPRVLDANATWHGLDGILVVVLRRADPSQDIDVTIEDASRTGVSIEWASEHRGISLAPAGAAVALLGAAAWRKRHDRS